MWRHLNEINNPQQTNKFIRWNNLEQEKRNGLNGFLQVIKPQELARNLNAS